MYVCLYLHNLFWLFIETQHHSKLHTIYTFHQIQNAPSKFRFYQLIFICLCCGVLFVELGLGGAQCDGVEHGGVPGPHREEGQPDAAELLATPTAALPAVGRRGWGARSGTPSGSGGRWRGRPGGLAKPRHRARGRAESAHGRDQRPTPSQPAQVRGVRSG